MRPVLVVSGSHRVPLSPAGLGLRVDVAGMVREALAASGGIVADVDVPARRDYRRAALARWLRRTARRLDRPARNASLRYRVDRLTPVPGRPGRRIDSRALERAIRRALAGRGPRVVAAALHPLRPTVRLSNLAAHYPAVITIDRPSRRLRLFVHLRLLESYPIAIGRAGLETPAGLFHVQDKVVNPPWHVPRSSWAGDLAGQTIPYGDARDPLAARWMGFFDGDGIHGTADLGSLGEAASHGCIRMSVPDVIDLYRRVPLGAPVFVL